MKNELMGVAASKQAKTQVEVELQCQLLGLLLNSGTTTFCFPSSLNSETPEAATLLAQRLVDVNPPNLRTLVTMDSKERTWNVRSFVDTQLQVFIKLDELRLRNFVCGDADLIHIAAHVPQLRYIISIFQHNVFFYDYDNKIWSLNKRQQKQKE
jgi:hypothetical protein